MNTKRGLLGYYNYTVILTYIGLLTALLGVTRMLDGDARGAVICLMVAGLCDMFDGAIASTRPRMPKEKRFGIQIDSLCDLICFGVLPAFITYSVNTGSVYYSSRLTKAVCGFYVLAALIRLAYFNVLEEERQRLTTGHREEYLGLPVTTAALLLPGLFGAACLTALPLAGGSLLLLAAMGVAFVLPVPLKKPYRAGCVAILVVGVVEFAVILLGTR